MNPGLVVKLRPAGPWRIGPDSGARNRVDVIYHSDSLYAAVTGALARLGSLDEWLGATARQDPPAVCFSSCFPFLDEIGFVIPPRSIWPPTAPALLSARVRWKSARFVPLGIVQALLAGQTLDGSHWSVDGPSECLVPAGRPGPFRTGVRFNAAVDRLTGAAERHSTAFIEFRAGSGLWAIVSFRDEAARARWSDPVKAAFRLLADSGFGGERSRGWGRSEAPEFIEGTLPDMILPKTEAPAPVPAEPEPTEPLADSTESRSEPGQPEEAGPSPVPESAVEAAPVEPARVSAPVPAESEPAGPLAASVESRPELAPMAMTPEPGEPQEPGPEAVPESPVEAAPAEAAPVPAVSETGGELAAGEPAIEAGAEPPATAESGQSDAESHPEPHVEAAHEPEAAPAETALPAEPSTDQPNAETTPAESARPATEPAAEAGAEPQPPSPTPASEPAVPGPWPPASEPKAPAYWLLSLFTPAASDAVDWRRGNYTILARGGRIDSPAGSGELKKQLNMVAEGSVLLADSAPCGSAPDVAPEGFAHPVFRAGFALSIPLPPHHEVS